MAKRFIIHPKYRKLGLGRMLLQITINYSRYLSKKKLMMKVEESQAELQLFLTRLEFKPTTTVYGPITSFTSATSNVLTNTLIIRK